MAILEPEERIGGKLAGKYRIDKILGEGGFAVVFAGVHEWTGRKVAIKILDHKVARDPENVERFFQEARAASSLDHPNVIDVLDMGKEEDGTIYLVLELLEGEDLATLVKRSGGSLPPQELGAIVLPIMRALAKAHDAGIVHRDIKPENIFLSKNGDGQPLPKLLDFGIAKVAGGSRTQTGVIFGTPYYMSPEQARGDRVGPSTDIWAIGMVLRTCLGAPNPFRAPTPMAVLGRILSAPVPPAQSSLPHLPAPLCAVLDRALAPTGEQRFASMNEFIDALCAALGVEAGVPVAPQLSQPMLSQPMQAAAPALTPQPIAPMLTPQPVAPMLTPQPIAPAEPAPRASTQSWTGGQVSVGHHQWTPSSTGAGTAPPAAASTPSLATAAPPAERGPGAKLWLPLAAVALLVVSLISAGVGLFLLRSGTSSAVPPPPPPAVAISAGGGATGPIAGPTEATGVEGSGAPTEGAAQTGAQAGEQAGEQAGAQGAEGAEGEAGEQAGAQGAEGAEGEAGEQAGTQGAEGAEGEAGAQATGAGEQAGDQSGSGSEDGSRRRHRSEPGRRQHARGSNNAPILELPP